MRRKNPEPQATLEWRYLTRVEAAAYLRTTPGTLAVWTSQGRIPAIRPRGAKGKCRKALYDRLDLDRIMAECKG